MASIVTHARRSLKHPTTKRVGWIVALGAAAAAAVGATIYFSEKSASAAGTSWVQMQPENTNMAGLASVMLPPNAVFAISDVATDPQLSTLTNFLNSAVSAGQIVSPQAYVAGQAAPSGYPSDGLGTNGYRATGVVGSTTTLSVPVSQTTTVWMKQMPTQNFLALITDPASVTQYQTAVANAIAAGNGNMLVAATQPVPTYSSSDVDGNPANPKWVALLSLFQQYVDSGGPLKAVLPGFPTSLRTDGVLDYATALVLMNQ